MSPSEWANQKKITRFRESFEEIISYLNMVAKNPLENLSIPKEIMDGLPIRWDLHQLYLLVENYYSHHAFQSMSFITVDEKLNIIDLFIAKVEFIKVTKEKGKNSFYLHFIKKIIKNSDINANQEKIQFFRDLNEKIKNHKPFQDILVQYLNKNFKISDTRSFILPLDYKKIIAKIIPDFNYNALETINKLNNIDEIIQKMGEKEKLKLNYIISQYHYKLTFSTLEKRIQNLKNIDLDKWTRIITTLYDESISNLIIVSKTRKTPLIGVKIVITNNKARLNPLPLYLLKGLFENNAKLKQIAQNIFKKTQVRTQVLDEEEILAFLDKLNDPSLEFYEFFTYLVELIYTTTWYPDSLLNEFLKLFGFQIGPGMTQFNIGFRSIVKYYESILIMTFQKGFENENPTIYLVNIIINKGKTNIKLIESKDMLKIVKDEQIIANPTIDLYKKIQTAIEKEHNMKFNACFGLNIDVLKEYLSAKNIEALLNMKEMAQKLPILASLGDLFAGMKQIENNKNGNFNLNENKINQEEDNEQMNFKTYFDNFIKKGIIFHSNYSKGKNGDMKPPLTSKDGFLEVNIETLGKLIFQDNLKS